MPPKATDFALKCLFEEIEKNLSYRVRSEGPQKFKFFFKRVVRTQVVLSADIRTQVVLSADNALEKKLEFLGKARSPV